MGCFPDPKNPVKMVTGTGVKVSSVGIGIGFGGMVLGIFVVQSLFGNERGSWRVSSGTSSSLSLLG